MQLHLGAAVQHEVEELQRVLGLLVGLRAHPGGEADQIMRLAPSRHLQVGEGGGELQRDLVVEPSEQVGIHDLFLPPRSSRTAIERPPDRPPDGMSLTCLPLLD